MTVLEFRSHMMEKVRAFDKWAYADVSANPADYEGYTVKDWYNLFTEFLEENQE